METLSMYIEAAQQKSTKPFAARWGRTIYYITMCLMNMINNQFAHNIHNIHNAHNEEMENKETDIPEREWRRGQW